MEERIILTESNVIDVYKKLTNQQNINQEEIDQVKKRFNELAHYQSQ